jgi:hypothetical protein
MLPEDRLCQVLALSWPRLPSLAQVFAVYVTEVLGHKAVV